MSFITRCPSCGTAFKVVSDQLKISEGWVRCGHCQHVFDATLDLQPWWPGAELVDLMAQQPQVESTEPVTDEPAVPAPADSEPAALDETSVWPATVVNEADPGATAAAVEDEVVVWNSTIYDDGFAAADSMAMPLSSNERHLNDELPSAPEPAWEPAPELSFVRQAQRRAFWRRPAVRAALVGLSVLLLLLLLGQWVVLRRDALATQMPALQPWLQGLCRPLGCEVGAGRQLEDLSIDSSALLRRAPDRYAFDMVLKNAADQPLAAPALELTLTDGNDRVLVRRVFQPGDWPQARPTLAPRSEWPVRLELALSGDDALPVVGYRAILFYP